MDSVDLRTRCNWTGADPLMIAYHDTEWGVPVHDDTTLFEHLVLDGAQAGLSWSTILKKREGYREAFLSFDPERVAEMGDDDIGRLLQFPGIVRNRMKIRSAITNARALLSVAEEYGAFEPYLWSFVGGTTIRNTWRSSPEIPAETAESRAMSAGLRKRGFSFVGPTICYAMMQASGLVNDHLTTCFRHSEVG